MSRRWWSAPAYVVLAGLALALMLLLMPLNADESYTCRGSAVEDLISPEPQESAVFRANFFDSGWVCNHTARHRGEVAAIAMGALLAGATTWGLMRRRGYVD